MPTTPVQISVSVVLTCLFATRGLRRGATLPHGAPGVHERTRLLLGTVLLACAIAALVWLIGPNLPRVLLGLVGLTGAVLVGAMLPGQRPVGDFSARLRRLATLAALALIAPLSVANDATGLLIAGLVAAFALAIGLPAFAALVERLDESDLPDGMRALPAQSLAAGIVALGLAGSLSW